MFAETIKKNLNTAETKARLSRKHPLKFLALSAAAGFYIGLAFFVSYAAAGPFSDVSSPFAKVVAAAVFTVGLLLCVFAGSELYTGNALFMCLGVFKKRLRPKDALNVLCVSFAGNCFGAFALACVVCGSGLARPLALSVTNAAFAKAGLPLSESALRGVLCNVFVCLALWTASRVTSDGVKTAIIVFCVFSFVVSGCLHCVADMTHYFLASFLSAGAPFSPLDYIPVLFITALGNFAGGAAVAWLYCFSDN